MGSISHLHAFVVILIALSNEAIEWWKFAEPLLCISKKTYHFSFEKFQIIIYEQIIDLI